MVQNGLDQSGFRETRYYWRVKSIGHSASVSVAHPALLSVKISAVLDVFATSWVVDPEQPVMTDKFTDALATRLTTAFDVDDDTDAR